LAWAQHQPFLVIFSDNIRIFETCESAGLLSRKTVDLLCKAYLELRLTRHHLSLAGKPSLVEANKFKDLRANVDRIWHVLLTD